MSALAESGLEIAVFGEALVDFFPPAPGVSLERADILVRHLGGAPANVAVGLARLGRRVGLVTDVGADPFGAFVRVRLAQEGVDVSGVGVALAVKTGITFVSVAADGARSFLFFRNPSADQEITVQSVEQRRDLFETAHVLHLGSSTLAREPGRSATLRALEIARQSGALVSFDPNLRIHLWPSPAEARPLIARVLADTDILKVAEDELEPVLGTAEPAEALRLVLDGARGPAVAVVTLASRGALIAGRRVEPQRVPTTARVAVDATGAGDAFVAGLLGGLLDALKARHGASTTTRPGRAGLEALLPEDLCDACRLGNVLGGQAVTALGATTNVARPGT